MDPIHDFLDERCIFGPTLKTPASTVRREYETWCGDSGERSIKPQDLAEALRSRVCRG